MRNSFLATLVVAAVGAFLAPAALQSQDWGNSKVEDIKLLLGAGTRPRFSPDGSTIVFDRRNLDGYYSLYLSSLNGVIWAGLTDDIHPRHGGNGIFDRTSAYILYIAQEPNHYLSYYSPAGQLPIGEPGVGLFNNLWITNGPQKWRLTNVPLKANEEDPTPVFATVNPKISPGGATVVWTERYDSGGNLNWGLWRIKAGELAINGSTVSLVNQRVLFTPATGTYVTAMQFLNEDELLLSGNLDGQHEYGMDLYRYNITDGTLLNLTNSPNDWEEGACLAPSGKIVYMTNRDSEYELDFAKDWVGQPLQRDYYVMNGDGSNKERLTFFNSSPEIAKEHVDWNAVTIACDISPDGKTIAGTVGRDFGDETLARLHWQIWLIKLKDPL